MPIQVDQLEKLLNESNYDPKITQKIVHGFWHGFDIGYRGPLVRRSLSSNIPLRVGSKTELWNKILKEVKANRVAGPYVFEDLPFENYIQSPVGLVPKADNKTRLIFHLSYNFGVDEDSKSLNYHTPKDWCSVSYNDLDHAIQRCLNLLKQDPGAMVYFSKSDASNAFRVLPTVPMQRKFLVLMAYHPTTGKQYYFVDMCLPFGASISCALYQMFSNALRHIALHRCKVRQVIQIAITNYLDDFLLMALRMTVSNTAVQILIEVFQVVGCPLSHEKTEFATDLITFLGVLLNGRHRLLHIPIDKKVKAINLLKWAIQRHKETIKFVQKLTGMLNFLHHVIVPGRVFTRCMYAKLKPAAGKVLKQHHHIWLDREFIMDCHIWLSFLADDVSDSQLCRPFVDFTEDGPSAELTYLASDASLNPDFGMGAVYGNQWMYMQWPQGFVKKYSPSIEFLELYALVAAIMTWNTDTGLRNTRATVLCDNEALVHMINNSSSSCRQCMKLLRLLVVDNLKCNRRIFAKHIRTQLNILPDSLSRMNFKRFWKNTHKTMNKVPDSVTARLLPIERVMDNEFYQLK